MRSDCAGILGLSILWLGKIDPKHDLSDHPTCQLELAEKFVDAVFIMAAPDCSTKTRAREIPRTFSAGRKAPFRLGSNAFPMGLPSLSARDKQRVEIDNRASDFTLSQIKKVADR